MAQKLNKKLVGLLVVSVMLLMTVTGFVLVSNLPERDPTKYAEDGERFLKSGDYDRALQAFSRAHQKDRTQSPTYLVKAARCAIELNEIGKARQLIMTAKLRDARDRATLELDLDIELELAPYIGSINQWNEVISRAQGMLEMDEFAESAKVHYALGRAYLEMRKEDATYEAKGEAALKRSIELDPSNIDAVTALAEQMSRSAMEKEADRQRDEAKALRAARLALISTAIDKCTGDEAETRQAALRILQARMLIVDGEVERGVAELRRLADRETTQTDARFLMGRLLMGGFVEGVERDLESAERYLKSAIEVDPKNPLLYTVLGNVYRRQSEAASDESVKTAKRRAFRDLYQDALQRVDISKHFRMLANNRARVQFFEELLLDDLGQARAAKDDAERERFLKTAEQWIERMKQERQPDSLEVRFATAHLYAARGDVVSATREAEGALAAPGGARNAAVLRLCADLYMRQGQWGTARDTIAKLLSIEPGDPSLYTGMGRILLNLNQATEALAFLRPSEPAQVRDYLENDRLAIALRIEAYRQRKEFDLAEKESRRLDTGTPDDEVRAAAILVWEKKYADAERKLKGILESSPDHEQAVRTMLQMYEESGRRDEGERFIEELVSRFPENRRIKQLRLAYGAGLTDEERDEQILAFIMEEPDEFIRHTTLVGYYERRDQVDKAIASLDRAEQLKPDEPTVIDAQFALAIRKSDWDRAARYAKKSGDLNTDGTMGKIAEGRLALARAADARAKGKADEAKRYADQAIDMMRIGLDNYPNHSQGWTYLAGAYLDAGRIDDAKATLQRALQINPANAYASMFLARIAANEGEEARERQLLADAARTLQDDPWIKERQRYYREKDDPRAGIVYREKIMQEKPNDTDNLVQLARLYANSKVAEHDKAAATYEKALAQADNDLGLAVEIADFYVSPAVNRPSEGERLLKSLFDSEEDQPKKALIATALGRFYEKNNVLATADRHYRQALFLDESYRVMSMVAEFYSRTGRPREALEQYKKMLEVTGDDADRQRECRSRMIALHLSMSDLDPAKELIDDYLVRYPTDPQGMIFEGAYHRVGGDIDKAKSALDVHLQRDPDNPVALWQRGQLYMLRGRWELAIEDLKKAKALKPDAFNYQHRIALSDALIEVGRNDEAISELQLILEADPDQSAVAEALIDAYTRVRPARFADAENLVYRYQSRNPRDPRWPTLLGKLGELALDSDKAIAGYESAAEISSYQPESIRALFAAYRAANRPQKIIQCASEKLSTRLLDRIPEALSSLGWAYAQVRMHDKCHEAFDRALVATGANFQAYSAVVGDIVRTLGKEAALDRAREQSDADPENVAKVRALVHLYKLNDRTEDALKTCDRVQEIAASDADIIFARLARGMLLTSAGKLVEARGEYEAVLRLDPDQTLALNNLAYLLGERLNLPAEALPYAKKAAQLRPNDANLLDTYGWTLFLNDRIGEAAGALLRALEQEDRDRLREVQRSADIRYHMGMLYKRQGKLEDARAMLDIAQKIAVAQGRTDDVPKKIEQALKDLGPSGG